MMKDGAGETRLMLGDTEIVIAPHEPPRRH
jgi:hypothetical protein